MRCVFVRAHRVGGASEGDGWSSRRIPQATMRGDEWPATHASSGGHLTPLADSVCQRLTRTALYTNETSFPVSELRITSKKEVDIKRRSLQRTRRGRYNFPDPLSCCLFWSGTSYSRASEQGLFHQPSARSHPITRPLAEGINGPVEPATLYPGCFCLHFSPFSVLDILYSSGRKGRRLFK